MNPFGWFTKSVVQNPWVTLLIFGAATLMLAAGLPKVKVDNDIKQFFPSGDKRVDFFHAHRDIFGADDTTVTLLVELPQDLERTIDASWLNWIDSLGKDLLEIEGVENVGSITETSILHGKDGELIISPLLGSDSVFEEDFETRFEYLGKSPLTRDRFFSESLRTALITVQLDSALQDPTTLRAPLQAIRDLVGHSLDKGVIDTVHFGGIPFIRVETLNLIRADVQVLFPLSLLVIAILLVTLFRNWLMVILPLLTIMVGTMWTAGAVGWLGISLTPLSAPFPILILILSVADGVHFLCRFEAERQAGLSTDSAIIEAGTHVGTACLLTSFTTALGFASLLITRMDILQSFGMVVAIGVGSTYITVMTLLPCGLKLLTSRPSKRKPFHMAALQTVVHWSSDARNAKAIASFGFILTAIMAFLASGVSIDYFVLRELPQDHPLTETGHRMDQEFGGMSSIEVNLSGPMGTFKSPESLKVLEEIEQAYIDLGIHKPSSFAAVVKELNRHLGDGSFIPDSQAYISQLLLLLEMGDNFNTESYVTFDYNQARLIGSFQDIGALKFYGFEKELTKKIETIIEGTDLSFHVTGASSVASLGFHTLLGELTLGLALALGVILVIIGVVYRNWRMAIVSIVPNTFPLFFGLACYATLGEPLNFASAMIFTIIIGIAVDDTIHVLSRYHEEKSNGKDGHEAVTAAATESLHAILMTTIILVCGFMVLSFSDFPANRSFGFVGSGLVASALLADLVFLPALLRTFDKPGSETTHP